MRVSILGLRENGLSDSDVYVSTCISVTRVSVTTGVVCGGGAQANLSRIILIVAKQTYTRFLPPSAFARGEGSGGDPRMKRKVKTLIGQSCGIAADASSAIRSR